MQTMNRTSPVYTEGLTAAFNVTVALDAFLAAISETNPPTTSDTSSIAQSPSTEVSDELAWQYLYCTEFGMFLPSS
jgi:hypothetical protein